MPLQTVPGTSSTYTLIAFDRAGRERTDDPDGRGGRMTATLLDEVQQRAPTNIFLFSHGWKGDMAAAIDQYNRWIGAMLGCTADAAKAKEAVAGFNPLFIGLHWPSLPWGDDELAPAGSFAAGESPGVALGPLKARYIDRLGDTPAIRAALDVVFKEAAENAAATTLSQQVVDAYQSLNAALDLGGDGVAAAPDADREPFDPEASFQLAQTETQAGFGGFDWGGILAPLRQLSFWTMKRRARTVGESGMHGFVAALQSACPAKIHLMGHSFGCIVVSSILRGTGTPLPRPVDSTALVQGALSLWAYCPDIPKAKGKPGFYSGIIAGKAVSGPIVTTRSKFDTAVGRFYPIAAGLVGQVDFDASDEKDLPKYGGVGTFGIRGLTAGVAPDTLAAATHEYGFKRGTIYNLDASGFIKKGDGASGAHNDIDGPEVAHAIWQAAGV
jgi:hypothetical protein